MPALAPPALVTGAPRLPLPYGLFSTFTFRGPSDRWEAGVEWEQDTCAPLGGIGQPQCVTGTSEVQRIATGGTVTGGTFTLTYKGATTAAIAWNATAAQVATALRAITIDALSTAGGPLPATAVTVTFAETVDQPQITGTSSLTGTSPTLAVTTTTPGVEETTSTLGLPKSLAKILAADGLASPFTVYGHFTCSTVGFDQSEALAKASLHLTTREEARVEQALWTGDLGNTPNFTQATKVGGGTALAPGQGLGAVEQYLASQYGGQGVIHMTRATATDLLGKFLLTTSGGRLLTQLGTPVVAGSGYDGSDPTTAASDPTAGKPWIVGTGAMFGYRSEIFDSAAVAYGTNDLTAVAERSYLLGYDQCWTGGSVTTQLDLALT